MNKKIKTIFIGTPDFGASSLEALIKDKRFDVMAAITQEDRPAGRKQALAPPPIKIIAQKHGLSVLQPKKIKDITEKIKNLKPDIIVVIAYSQLIPPEILNIPKFGCINVHGSLLPKYRGAAVIQAAILNGDEQTGITIMKMDERLDTGSVLARATVDIKNNDTAGSLYEKLSNLGPQILVDTLIKYSEGKITPRPQKESESSYVGTIKKSDGMINWSKPANEIERFVRAMSPWPSAWTWWKGKQIKITQVQHRTLEINSYKPGKSFIYNGGLAVQCGRDALIIRKLQLEGKKELTIEEFLRGQKDFIGSILT